MIEAVVVAGPNGAGKTTFAREMLSTMYPGVPFLNVDELQADELILSHPIAAGREFLRRLAEVESRRASFAVETTLASKKYASWIARWRTSGYRVSLHFIELPSADLAVQRVAMRVAAGGHAVPEADVRRRFERGATLFQDLYKSLVDEWYHWHSDEGGLQLVEYRER